MRPFIFLLLLVIVFLAGIIVGNDRSENKEDHIGHEDLVLNQSENEPEEEAVFIDYSEELHDPELNTDQLNRDLQKHATQRVASFMEKGVKGLYEIIINILYQISSLFF